ncbi:MAG: hypothetical protein NVS2B3_01710 [Vulcanimicrobiaceae bacterium]
MKSGESGGFVLALGVGAFALFCCAGPLLAVAFGAAALGGVATLVHGPVAVVAGVGALLVAALLGYAVIRRRRNATCAANALAPRHPR